MSYENFDPNDLLIQSYSTKPSGFVQRIPHGIRAIHLPTGTVVTCDADRSQHKNRHDALTQLWELVHGKPTYQDLQAERDALAAQVEFFAKSFSELREHHVANFHLKNPFIGNLALHENWRLITHAISAENGVLHDLIYRAWVDGFEASSCCFNGEYSEDEKRPYVLAKCFADGVANKPSNSYQHHLREVRAEALQKAIHAVANKYDGSDTTNLWCIGANHVLVLFGKYADSIRQGEVK